MKKILLCTDGSAYSEVCCRYAAWLAKRSNAAVEVFYLTDIRQFEIPFVADLSGSLGVQPYRDMITQLQSMEKQKAAASLSEREENIQGQRYSIEKDIQKLTEAN